MKLLFILTFFSNLLFSCTLCTIQTPTIHVTVDKKIIKQNTTFNVRWTFNKAFTKQTLDGYPKEYHIKFKLQEIKKSLKNYLVKNNYLTFITYGENQTYRIKQQLKSDFDIKSDRFVYKYSFDTNITAEQNKNINIKFDDAENYFVFNFNQQNIVNKSINKQSEFVESLSKILLNITDSIKELLQDINSSNSFISYVWLLLFSFGYGVLHAIGPGHGKSLISSYFLSDSSSHSKALIMSSLIGVVHTFSAFILTFIIYYSVNIFLGNYFADIESIVTKISAVVIIFIAIYLIYKKLIKHKAHSHCECTGCKTHSTDIGVILGAGIVPCAGTVTIFIYTMSLNLYFIGFLSAIFMSLGMSVIIYITALLSIKIRDKSSSNTKLLKVLEYGSLVFILALGILLFIA